MRTIHNTDRPDMYNTPQYLEVSSVRCEYLLLVAIWLHETDKFDSVTGIYVDELFIGFCLSTLVVGAFVLQGANEESLYSWYGTIDKSVPDGDATFFDSFEELVESVVKDQRCK